MKIAFSTSADDLSAPLDSRFGRSPKFLIYDLEANTFTVIDNQQNMNASQGAGVQAAETIARAGAVAVITGHCGPKAHRALTAAGIEIYNTAAPTVADALTQYLEGKLSKSGGADVEGHW